MNEEQPSREQKGRAARSRGLLRRILVVDDDESMRALLVTALIGDGYQVLEAASGDAAAEELEARSIREWSTTTVDLVLSDVRMAMGDGLRLGRMIRQAGWPIPLIFLTAFPDADVRIEADRLDAQLLAKPCSIWLLRRVVLTTLARATA